MRRRGSAIAAFVFASCVFAFASGCGDEGGNGNGNGNTGGGDAGPVTDSGVRDLCPVEQGTACTKALDCQANLPAPSNCAGCRPYNRSLCQLGRCTTPGPLTPGDPVNFLFQVDMTLAMRLYSFAGFAVGAESSGGKLYSCEDVYSRAVDLSNACHNILDTRGQEIDRSRPGNQHTMTFTRFASGRTTLFVVYGYEQEPPVQANPISVACGRAEVGAPGSGLKAVSGDMMRPIQ